MLLLLRAPPVRVSARNAKAPRRAVHAGGPKEEEEEEEDGEDDHDDTTTRVLSL